MAHHWYILRLDPLVAEVIVDSPDEGAMVADLTTRLPITVTEATAIADFSIGIGMPRSQQGSGRRDDGASPLLADVQIDTTLVGAGGVGAAFIRAVAALGPRVSGSLAIVDADALAVDNLNRVSYTTPTPRCAVNRRSPRPQTSCSTTAHISW